MSLSDFDELLTSLDMFGSKILNKAILQKFHELLFIKIIFQKHTRS